MVDERAQERSIGEVAGGEGASSRLVRSGVEHPRQPLGAVDAAGWGRGCTAQVGADAELATEVDEAVERLGEADAQLLGPRAVASILRNDHVDADAADTLARELGAAWARVVEDGAAPGARPGPRASKIVVYPASAAEGHRFAFADVRPAHGDYVTRLGQRLVDAGKKFAAFALPGIIVLEPPFLGGSWRVDVVVAIRRRLLRGAAWTDHVAALVLSETHAFAPHHQALSRGSELRILRGKRWSALPRSLQHRWGAPCKCCGVLHDHFDLLTQANELFSSMSDADHPHGGGSSPSQ